MCTLRPTIFRSCITIRKFAKSPLTVEKLIGFGALTPQMALFLHRSVVAKRNIVISGGTGSGKTTLLNVLSGAIPSEERIVTSEEESRALNRLRMPAIILSASGMATGGRVVHHLKAYVPDARNAVVFAGFQAAGTRGASLVGGAKEIRIHGDWIPVRAEVATLDGLSAHADRDGLLAWIGALPRAPQHVYVTHGEPSAADALRQAIQERHGWPCSVPEYLELASG